MGAGGAGGRRGEARLLPHVPRPHASPTRYERTLPDVFPDTAPGQLHLGAGARPLGVDDVQRLPVGPRLHEPRRLRARWPRRCSALAAVGVDVLRLDAAPFLWKRVGHELPEPARGPRAAAGVPGGACGSPRRRSPSRPRRSSRRATSSPTSATGRHEGKECDLAYHNVLMVLLWSALASGRVALMTQHAAARCRRSPPGAGWVTYVRCHDDIGWAITRRGRRARWARTRTCTGASSPTSTPATSRARSRAARASSPTRARARRARAGPRASLAGLEARCSRRRVAVELAVRRVLLLYAVAFAHGGLPLIYMGDELGLLNDPAWADDPAHADDNRWMHRPRDGLGRRPSAGTIPRHVEGRLWAGLQRLIAARRATRAIHAQGAIEPLWTGNDHVFGAAARARGRAAAAARQLHRRTRRRCRARRRARPRPRARRRRPPCRTGGRCASDGDYVVLEPYQFAWLHGAVGA